MINLSSLKIYVIMVTSILHTLSFLLSNLFIELSLDAQFCDILRKGLFFLS